MKKTARPKKLQLATHSVRVLTAADLERTPGAGIPTSDQSICSFGICTAPCA